jgi:nucleoside 2-deoxyribosyltransferase
MKTRIFNIYIAGPLFTLAERQLNLRIADAITARLGNVQCIVPQVRADAFLPDLHAVVKDCFAQVDACDLVLANLDGPDCDSGTSAEIGYAFAKGKTIIGFRTDFRDSEVDGVNSMLRYACTKFVLAPSHSATFEDLTDRIQEAFAELFTR